MSNRTIMYMITNNCNLRCKYCYVPKDFKVISDEVIMDSIPFVENMIKTSHEKPSIHLFGGEPLLYFDKVRLIVDNIKKLESKYGHISIVVFTNAMLLNDKIVEYLQVKDVGINLSLDGCQKSHDANRIDCKGCGSYDEVYNNIDNYYNITNKRRLVKYVINPNNVQYLFESVQDFYSKNMRWLSTSFTRNEQWDNESLVELDKQLEQVAKFFVGNYTKGDFIEALIYPIMDYEYKSYAYCSAGKEEIAINMDGDLYPCPYFIGDIKYRLGNVKTGIDDSLIFAKFIKNYSVESFMKQCKDCDTFKNYNCLGQCLGYVIVDNKGRINKSACEVHKIAYKHALYIYSKLSNNEDYIKSLNIMEDMD